MSKKTKRAPKARSPKTKTKAAAPAAPAVDSGIAVVATNKVLFAPRKKRRSIFDPMVDALIAANDREKCVLWPIPEGRRVERYRAQVYTGVCRSLRSKAPAFLAQHSVSVLRAADGTLAVSLK